MSLKKYFFITCSALLVILILYTGASYWMGVKTEETLRQQYQMLSDIPLFKIQSHSYHRGIFSSTETINIAFNRKLLAPYESVLPEQIRGLLGKNISYTQHINHGPLPRLSKFNFTPARAFITTEVVFSKSTIDTLKRFFGNNKPITIQNIINFSGSGKIIADIPAFYYDEALSGVKINWKGFNLNINYSPNFTQHNTNADLPNLSLSASSKGDLLISNIHYSSTVKSGNTGVSNGGTSLTIGDIDLHWKEDIPYKIKLNELVNMITRLHVGEFINPRGELHMSDVTLKNLRYKTTTKENGEYINAQGNLDFDQFSFNKSIYGPMKLDVSASHLHGATLAKIGVELRKLPSDGMDSASLRHSYIDVLRKDGSLLLTNNPKVTLNEFSLRVPDGMIHMSGQINIKDLQQSDMNNPDAFIKHINANLYVDVPYPTLEGFVVTQAHSLFMVDDSSSDKPNINDIDNLARQFFHQQVRTLKQQGYIDLKGSQLQSNLSLKAGIFTVNNKRVSLPWEELNNVNQDDPTDLEDGTN